jgi:hypothetical protein
MSKRRSNFWLHNFKVVFVLKEKIWILVVQNQIRVLMVSIRVIVLQAVERVMLPVPWFDLYTPIPLCCGPKESLDLWRGLLVNQVIWILKVVQRVR